MSLILASASPRRKTLLEFITKDFTVIPAKNEEKINSTLTPQNAVEIIAKHKAEEVSAIYPKDTIIGADTMVFLGNTPMGKPIDKADAKRMLSALSGKTHMVITAVCIAVGGASKVLFNQSTDVTFYELSEKDIDDYISTGEPMDKAGAYGIQGYGSLVVKSISGDYYNVMGLPVGRLYRELTKFNLDK